MKQNLLQRAEQLGLPPRSEDLKISTRCVHLPPGRDPFGAVSPPIYQTATFRQPSAVDFGEYDYSRTANPTRALAEEQIAALEGGRHACAFASGMAAITAVTRRFTTGDPDLSRRIVEAARLFTIAVSFGSVGSSISLPCRMSHASVPPELRGRLGPPADLVRLSIGIEDVDDLTADLAQALESASTRRPASERRRSPAPPPS